VIYFILNKNFHELCLYLKENRIYVIEKFQKKEIKDNNYITITYNWLIKINDFFSKIATICFENNINPDREYFWLDIVCINQFFETDKQLENLSSIYEQSNNHLLLSGDSLFRVWCIYEISLRNGKTLISKTFKNELNINEENWSSSSFVYGTHYIFKWSYEKCNSTFISDKIMIEKEIIKKYKTILNFEEMIINILTNKFDSSAWFEDLIIQKE